MKKNYLHVPNRINCQWKSYLRLVSSNFYRIYINFEVNKFQQSINFDNYQFVKKKKDKEKFCDLSNALFDCH